MTTRRLPLSLTLTMLVAAVTLALLVMAWNLHWPAIQGAELLVHGAACLCLVWSAVALLVGRFMPRLAGRPEGRDLVAILQVASLVTGLVVVIVMVYAAATEALCRTPFFVEQGRPWHVDIWRTGLVDLAFVAAAVMLAWGHLRDPQLLTVCFWVLILAGFWLALQIPAFKLVQAGNGHSYSETTLWAVPFLVFASLSLLGLTLAEAAAAHRRRLRAWPDMMSNLTRPMRSWPGLRYSAGIVCVVLMILGLIHITSPWATMSVFLAAVAGLLLVYRAWDENVADVAVGLLTLGIASLPIVIFGPPRSIRPEYFARIFNLVVIGLAVATFLWHWLAAVWEQQLNNGVAWTTAGQLIRTLRRVGFLAGATGVLVSMELAFWPRFPQVEALDSTPARWVWGLSADVLLLLCLVYASQVARKPTLAWLALFAVVSTAAFVMVRQGDSRVAQWWTLYWPVAMAVAAGLALLLKEAASRWAGWRPFEEPLLLSGVLILPLAAVAGIAQGNLLNMPTWVSAGVFAVLTVVYLVAAVRPGPRGFLAVSGVCAVMLVWHLRRWQGPGYFDSPYQYGAMVGLALLLFGITCRERPTPAAVHLVRWTGAALFVGFVLSSVLAP